MPISSEAKSKNAKFERHYQHFFTWIVCGVAASGTYMGIVTALDVSGAVTGNHQGGIISAILFLVPGFPMVTAMLDLFRQDFSMNPRER